MAEEMIRLLLCLDCKSMEELPDYEGDPRGDALLNYLIAQRHTIRDSGTTHRGNLVKVPKRAWDTASLRKEIEQQIRDAVGGGDTGLGASFYAAKNTFQEDAMSCWSAHNRTQNCDEYMTERKVLSPTQEVKDAWADAGEKRPKNLTRQEYLCRFCPVHSVALQAARKKAGMYG